MRTGTADRSRRCLFLVPYSPECVELDFSHLEAAGQLCSTPSRTKGGEFEAPASCCSDLGKEARRAPKWATLRLLTRSSGPRPFGSVSSGILLR